MNKIKEIVRLLESNHSQRQIANILGVSRGSIQNYASIVRKNDIRYKDIIDLGDEELLNYLGARKNYRETDIKFQSLIGKFPEYSRELNRTGVTLRLLWEEYKSNEVNGYGYSQFCFHYYQWKELKKVSMHMEHKYGDKMFVDFCGDKLKITNPQSGLETEVEVFVAVLGGSGLAYVEAVSSQKKEDFIKASENSILYFGGVPRAIVPDCLKSGVTNGNKYEPEINPDYSDFARHYDTVVLPARPYRPKDKSLVENGVKLAYQRIFAPIRNKIFTSLEELNESIREHLEIHNSKLMSKVNISRRDLFERYEKDTLKQLPTSRYEFKQFATATVQINYHIYLREDGHYYSVPYRLKSSKVSSHILNSCKHPEQGFKSCIGIISLAKKFGSPRLNKACEIALSYKEFSYKFINNILQRGTDKLDTQEQELPFSYPIHENIRGKEYYNSLKENLND